METASITIKRTSRSEVTPIKLTPKLQHAMWEADNGHWVSRSLEDVLNL
jgi:hypothetical protein